MLQRHLVMGVCVEMLLLMLLLLLCLRLRGCLLLWRRRPLLGHGTGRQRRRLQMRPRDVELVALRWEDGWLLEDVILLVLILMLLLLLRMLLLLYLRVLLRRRQRRLGQHLARAVHGVRSVASAVVILHLCVGILFVVGSLWRWHSLVMWMRRWMMLLLRILLLVGVRVRIAVRIAVSIVVLIFIAFTVDVDVAVGRAVRVVGLVILLIIVVVVVHHVHVGGRRSRS